MNRKPALSASEISLVGLFAALTAVGSFIRLPIPYVPLTLQTLMVMFSGILLGAKLGALSQFIYLLIGLLGLPVFAYGGGPGYILQPTFGYLIGFIPGAYVLGKITERKSGKISRLLLIAGLVSCMLTIYLIGTFYLFLNITFVQHKPISLSLATKIGFLAPLPADVLKLTLVAAIGPGLKEKLSPYLPGTLFNATTHEYGVQTSSNQ